MKTRAAVLRKAGTPWEITELELDAPQANKVLIQMEAASAACLTRPSGSTAAARTSSA